jgi:hypothetical protein
MWVKTAFAGQRTAVKRRRPAEHAAGMTRSGGGRKSGDFMNCV